MFSKFFPFIKKASFLRRKTGFNLFLLFVFTAHLVFASENSSEILSIASKEIDKSLEIRISSTSATLSTVYLLPGPERIVVDIADAKLSKQFVNQIDANSAKVQTKEITDAKPNICRFEIFINGRFTFESRKENSDIVLNISRDVNSSPVGGQNISGFGQENQDVPLKGKDPLENNQQKKVPQLAGKDKIGGLISSNKNIDNQLPDINPLENKISPKAKELQMQDAFNFSGYNKDRITVEFQKMDLHNVFNFLRQVSGVNIVVDESVKGSLTLVLDDVPWDFALDIILNLKDLEKEERFNTLVIYPKNKGFKWPEQGKNNLSFQADTKVVEKEALVIKQQQKEPIESAEAKQDIALGKEAEKTDNFETAVGHYEKALEKWPSNSKLANKIASIYLVQLRQNAKSLYYSKIALDKDPNNAAAALNAAIASANMQDKQKAVAYFTQCTQVKQPSKESLLSYAAFSEEQREYPGALKILEKFNALYGEDLDSMVAAARIYDKMGQQQQATEKYNKIILSGFSVPPDLDRFIKGRVALK
jgi:type IV pilus assembly protein PilQ